MSILRNPNRHRYTVIDSSALEDTAISFEAKGVLAYLLSKPDGWVIHQEHLSRMGGIGRHKMMRIFSELRKAGYIAYKKPRNEFGQVEGTEIVLCETPHREESGAKPDHGITRESENPTVGKPDPLVNLESLVNLDTSVNLEENLKEAPPIGSDPVVDPPKPLRSKPPAIQLDYSAWPTMPSAQVMADWVAARKTKRAPISQTVIDQFGNELRKAAGLGYSVDQCLAECITSGWQGFKAAWIANRNNTGGTNGKSGRSDRESVSARAVREAAEFIADLDAAERLERDQADGGGGVYENELALPWEGIGGLPGAR